MSNNDREKLQFKKEVLAAFAFLESNYNFRCTKASDYVIRFEHENIYIEIIHDRLSFETFVQVGSIKDDTECYDLNDVFHLDVSDKTKNIFYQSSNPSGVKKCIKHLADAVKYYSEMLINEYEETFKSLSIARTKQSEEYMLEMELSQARENAAKAWKSKDYEQYIKVFSPLQKHLSKSELKKLKYALTQQQP